MCRWRQTRPRPATPRLTAPRARLAWRLDGFVTNPREYCGLVAYWALASVSSVFMDLSQLSQEQFKELVRGIVDDRLRELLGDPDLGLQLGYGLRSRLK